MDQSATESARSAPAEPVPALNFGQRLSGIFFEPRATFQDVDRRGGWLGIFLLICALALTSMYVLTIRIDHETYMRKALEMSPFTRSLSEQQIQEIVSRPQSPVQRYSGFVLAPVGILVTYLVMAAALMVTFLVMGASLNFKKSFAVTIWGLAPAGIVLTLLGILFMYVKDPETLALDPGKNVASNLGLLVSDKAHPALASLLGSIDIFSAWSIALLAIGFSVISRQKLTLKSAALGVMIPWLIWVLGKAGFAALFS